MRGIIRTNYLVGEIGEYIVKDTYSQTPNLPRLQNAPTCTKNFDVTSIDSERYAIKSSSTNTTVVFNSIPLNHDGVVYFEFLVVVCFTRDL